MPHLDSPLCFRGAFSLGAPGKRIERRVNLLQCCMSENTAVNSWLGIEFQIDRHFPQNVTSIAALSPSFCVATEKINVIWIPDPLKM